MPDPRVDLPAYVEPTGSTAPAVLATFGSPASERVERAARTLLRQLCECGHLKLAHRSIDMPIDRAKAGECYDCECSRFQPTQILDLPRWPTPTSNVPNPLMDCLKCGRFREFGHNCEPVSGGAVGQ